MKTSERRGATNKLFILMLGSAVIVILLSVALIGPPSFSSGRGDQRLDGQAGGEGGPGQSDESGDLLLYCAAGIRYAMDDVVDLFEEELGVKVQPQYQGSNTLLSQMQASPKGDLFLAADDSYIQQAREKGLVVESMPIARQRPVIVVHKANPKKIKTVEDLLRQDVRVALGNPGAAAVGKTTQRLLSASGHWSALEQRTTTAGVFTPTVNELANAVDVGSVDAGVVWDSTAKQYPNLMAIRVPELDAGTAQIEIAVVATSKRPTTALRFARFASARDRGQRIFAARGFDVLEGDVWDPSPEITFFAGAVNRRALEPIIEQFERREGVTVNTVYNGCGILTGQMKIIQEKQDSGFPDTYMACDVYYLNSVKEWFQEAVNVSDTDIVIAVKKGNPKGIKGLEDLLRDDVRLVLGQPDQCTIGVLSKRLLLDAGIYGELMQQKDVPMKASSAMLVPDVITGSSDATLAYRTDTRAAANQVDVVTISGSLSKAIQPFAIARSSEHKYLGRRLYSAVARSRDVFQAAGFNWRLDDQQPTHASSDSAD